VSLRVAVRPVLAHRAVASLLRGLLCSVRVGLVPVDEGGEDLLGWCGRARVTGRVGRLVGVVFVGVDAVGCEVGVAAQPVGAVSVDAVPVPVPGAP
jgi:hypothetical protein